jgi:hypothetical protein
MKSPFWCVIAVAISRLLISGAAFTLYAAEVLPLDPWYDSDKRPFPAHAKITLQLPGTVMIGEDVKATLVIENTGSEPFEIVTGGDYRTTGYPQRMKVRVRDQAGNLLPELPREAYGFGGGGMGGPRPVAAGETDGVEFPLACYVSFPGSGTYTVTAGHDLGWKLEKGGPQPAAHATVIVKEPTAAEATEHVKGIFDAQPTTPPRNESDKLGREMALDHKLCTLRHPVYLAPLRERAEAGSVQAVNGLGHMTSPEATRALLALLQQDSPAILEAALVQLSRRIPSLQDGSKNALPYWWISRFQIEPLLPTAWRPEFEQPLLDAVPQLLSRDEIAVVDAAAVLLKARGKPEHAPAILHALQKSLDVPCKTQSGPNANVIDPPRPQRNLIEALDCLRALGWRADPPSDTAQMVAWFRQLADKNVPKPTDIAWSDIMLSSVTSGPATLRVCALKAIPQPMNDAATRVVRQALEDPDWRVIRAACEVAGESKRSDFNRPLSHIIETIDNVFLRSAAHHAAVTCGARLELWEAWTSVIPDADCTCEAVQCLALGTLDFPPTEGSSGTGGFTDDQRIAIRDAWRAFLKRHAKELAAGQKVKVPGRAASAKLGGSDVNPGEPVVVIRFRDGTQWPPKLKE